MVYIIFISVAVPLIMLLFVLEKHLRAIIGFVIIGIACAVVSCEINSLLKELFRINEFDFRIFVSPITEEIIKFLPILLFAFPKFSKKQHLVEFSMALGIGFAIFENIYLLVWSLEYVNIVWSLIRGFSTGLMHGMTTTAVSFIMRFINKRKLFFTGMLGLLCIAITYHGIYNLLVESKYNYLGLIIPISTYILILCILKSTRALYLK